MLALLNRMHDHRIRRGRKHQRASWVTRLSPGLLAAFLTQALGLPMKAIRGRRQMAVVTVFLELVLQRLHLILEEVYLLLELLSQGLLLLEEQQTLFQPVDLLLLPSDSFPQRLILLLHFFFWVEPH